MHTGLALVGLCLNGFTAMVKCRGIPHADVLRSYEGLLSTGKSDYEAITDKMEDEYFKESLGIGRVPSAETLRQKAPESLHPNHHSHCWNITLLFSTLYCSNEISKVFFRENLSGHSLDKGFEYDERLFSVQ